MQKQELCTYWILSEWLTFSCTFSVFDNQTRITRCGCETLLPPNWQLLENSTLYHTILTFNDPELDAFRKRCGKKRKCW